jgi:hypothetical protein
MTKQVDRNQQYMYDMWGTTCLTSDYGCLEQKSPSKMLREINHDDLTPKKHDFGIQKELHSKIRNDDDYDDWEYGTEPIFG